MAITPLDIDKLAQPLVDTYNGVETDLMMSIARRLVNNGNEADATTMWQLKMLAQMGALTKDNAKIIAEATGRVPEMTLVALQTAIDEALKDVEPDLADAARQGLLHPAPGINMSSSLKSVLDAYNRQAAEKLNLTNTTMLHQAEQAYRNIINKTTFAVASGGISRQEALAQTIGEFADKGLPGLIDKRGRQWTPEAYTGMVIKTTVHNTALAAADARMQDYGVDVFEVSVVAGARPLCAPYQGKLIGANGSGETEDIDGHKLRYMALSETSYGQPAGLFGINCHHTKSPWIPGYAKKTYQPTQDEDENAKQYQQSQQQRALERDIRKTKREADMLKTAGLDDSGAQSKVRAQQARMREFINKTGRTRRSDREQIHAKGRTATADRAKAFQQKTSASDIQQYNKYASVIGEANIPGGLAGFQKMKYTDAEGWKALKGYVSYKEKYPTAQMEHYQIYAELGSLDIKNGAVLPPEKVTSYILEDPTARDPSHIMKRMRERNITDDQVHGYVDNALVMFSQRKGDRKAFYSPNGVTVAMKSNDDWIAKTAWDKSDFDENTDKILEVIKKYVKG